MEASMLAKLGPAGSTSPRLMSPADRQVGTSTRISPLLHGCMGGLAGKDDENHSALAEKLR